MASQQAITVHIANTITSGRNVVMSKGLYWQVSAMLKGPGFNIQRIPRVWITARPWNLFAFTDDKHSKSAGPHLTFEPTHFTVLGFYWSQNKVLIYKIAFCTDSFFDTFFIFFLLQLEWNSFPFYLIKYSDGSFGFTSQNSYRKGNAAQKY